MSELNKYSICPSLNCESGELAQVYMMRRLRSSDKLNDACWKADERGLAARPTN